MNKTEIYTWRLSPATKAALEEEARRQNRSIADLLEEIVTDNLGAGSHGKVTETEHQRMLHARAAEFAGRICGTDPRRGEHAKQLVRARLRKREHRAH